MKSCLDSISYFLLGCNDQKGTENDEREPEAILDKDIMKLVLVGVGQDQVDVVVWDVDGDQSGEEEEGTRRQSSGSAAWGEGKTDHPDDEGGDGTEDGGDVDGEVEGDLVQQVVWPGSDWAECEVCIESGLGLKTSYKISFLITTSFRKLPRFLISAKHLQIEPVVAQSTTV